MITQSNTSRSTTTMTIEESKMNDTNTFDRSVISPANVVLIGRENETEELDRILQEKQDVSTTNKGVPLVVVRGAAGSGKSYFVQAYPWKKNGWVLATGKFEEKRSQEPYSAIVDALTILIDDWVTAARQASSSSQQELEKLQKLLETEFELLKDVLPRKVFEIAGCGFLPHARRASKKDGHGDDDNDSSTRSDSDDDNAKTSSFTPGAVNAAFRRVISFLCSSSRDATTTRRPVALFLEDIHWVDRASLDIIEELVSVDKEIDGLVLVVSCREYVKEGHEVYASLQKIQATTDGPMVHLIDIVDLDSNNVNKLLTTILNSDPEETKCLAEVIYRKTAGNPFFVLQFLQLIREESFLQFSNTTRKWKWGDVGDLQKIATVSDNVADVVVATLHKLPDETQMALKVASCLGKSIPVDILNEYFKEFPRKSKWDYSTYECIDTIGAIGLPNVLDCAVRQGVLIRPDDSLTYLWSHDKLQHVAYSLIPKGELASLHTNLGQRLWKRSFHRTARSQAMAFMAADQLSRVSNQEKNEILGVVATHIHLKAAKLSMSKSALIPAMETLRGGAKVLSLRDDRWKKHYELSLSVYSYLAEIAVQIGLHDEAMEAVREIDEHANCLDDKFRSQVVMLKSLTSGSNRDYSLGVTKSLEVLQLYGEKLPTMLMPGQLVVETTLLKSRLPGRRLEGLMELPEMLDTRAEKVITLMARYLGHYAFLGKTQRQIASLATIRALNIAAKTGVSADTAVAVMWMAADLKREGHYTEACEYAALAVKMINKFKKHRGSTHALVLIATHADVFPAAQPFHNSLKPLLECRRVGLKIGDTESGMACLLGYTFSYLSIGFPLGPLESDLAAYTQQAAQLRMPYPMQLLFKILRQGTLNLIDKCEAPAFLTGEAMDQKKELARVSGGAVAMTLRDINTLRAMLACVYNKWDTAEAILDQLEPYLGFDGLVSRAHFRMVYMGLAAYVVGRKSGKRKYTSMANKITKKFKAEYKLGCVNAYPILAMLKAESSPSKERYDEAIKICGGLKLVHHQAYMCERAGVHCIEKKDSASGKTYLLQAYSLYNEWGATGKLTAMKHEYRDVPEFLSALKKSENSLCNEQSSQYSTEQRIRVMKFAWDTLAEGGFSQDFSVELSNISLGMSSDTTSNSE